MIEETCKERGIKHTYPDRLYYGRFSSKITIAYPLSVQNMCPVMDRHAAFAHSNDARWLKYKSDRKKYLAARSKFIDDLFSRPCIPVDSEYRNSSYSVTLYTNNLEALGNMIEEIDAITHVSTPLNGQVVAFLQQNPKKLVRKDYFYKTYQYRVNFSNYARNPHISDFLISAFGAERKLMTKLSGKYEYIILNTPTAKISSNGRALFLSSEDDLCLTQVALGNHISSIDQIVLTKDV